MSKATLADIAARAGVGTATVERVLNGRGGVSPTTA
ncbi:LacI family transcriptional regulator, partial [Escherichia coli]|nr:LacI family transcriptional regulator [Escherichia coli]